jgi:cbb3-type cytochrome oxidase subunit 3
VIDMNYSFLGSAMTVVMLVTFVGIVVWALGAGRNAAFDAAARVPMEDDTDPAAGSAKERV